MDFVRKPISMTNAVSVNATQDVKQTATAGRAAHRSSRGARNRRLREALLAYAFLLPAFVIVGLFGLFPLVFAAYQSTLRGINRIVGTFDGLGNYVRAVDVLTYVLGFWGAVILIWLALRGIRRGQQAAAAAREPFAIWSAPGVALGASLLFALTWLIRMLPLLLAIPDQMRGARNTPEEFRRLLGEALADPNALQALFGTLAALALGIVLAVLVQRVLDRRGQRGNFMSPFVAATAMTGLAALLLVMTWNELQKQIAEAEATNAGLEIWSQIVPDQRRLCADGALLVAVGQRQPPRGRTPAPFFRLGGAAALLVGCMAAHCRIAAGHRRGRSKSGGTACWPRFYYSAGHHSGAVDCGAGAGGAALSGHQGPHSFPHGLFSALHCPVCRYSSGLQVSSSPADPDRVLRWS
jgi:ABC-type sugar transport system permease subunit